ncbi:MAG: pyridoxine 5'-phosphate synthase [Pirellulales bacterium]
MPELGVNIDHVATLRQARRTHEPDPVWAAAAAELGGADCITIHLREDRRHIQDRDLEILRRTVSVKLNLELATARKIVEFACRVRPDQATLVPEKREEVTTEGGLDVVRHRAVVEHAVEQLLHNGIAVSLFIDPDEEQIRASKELGVEAIELHTGCYALAKEGPAHDAQLVKLVEAGRLCRKLGMKLHAGHGLNYVNVGPVAGFRTCANSTSATRSSAARSLVGMTEAVREMKRLISV